MSRALVTASLEGFARTGQLGPLAIGLTRDEVVQLLGNPTDFTAGQAIGQSDIWKYGDVEVYFADHVVWMLHFDCFDIPAGGPVLKIDPWVIRRGIPLSQLALALQISSIDFSTARNPSDSDCVNVVTSGGVVFVVQVEGEADELGLSIFGRSCA